MRFSIPFAAIAGATVMLVSGCGKSGPLLTAEVVVLSSNSVPLDPNDRAWDKASEHRARLILQDLVEPRQLEVSTQEVQVRAITDGSEVAFRLAWTDATTDDLPQPGKFLDGCALQIPSAIEASVPAPQMGEAGKRVEITFWRADWQASVNGRADSIQSIHPNASIDHYPFEAKALEKGSDAQREMATRYAPAASAGNRRVGPRDAPVEDLIAEGPGTLSPAPPAGSRGQGIRTGTGWMVTIVRRLPEGLAPQMRSQIAFAVWEGSNKETGARKMRSGWIPLVVKGGI
jgi:DMSO reductase family type II enzyme heme b subunit